MTDDKWWGLVTYLNNLNWGRDKRGRELTLKLQNVRNSCFKSIFHANVKLKKLAVRDIILRRDI